MTLFGTRRDMRAPTSAIVAALFAVAAIRPAYSHPHEFVEMWTEVQMDGTKATAMRYRWRFDEFFSAYALEPADPDGDGKVEQAEIEKVHAQILTNIQPIDYFTRFEEKSLQPKLGTATPLATRLVGRQLEIEFTVPFQSPVDLSEKQLVYAIYDNEFYIAMNHSVDDIAVQIKGAAKGCSSKMEEANPDEDVREFASSLGKDESGGQDLGINFAEWVVISCK